MKAFWALIAVLVLAAGGLLFMRGRGQDPRAGEQVQASSLPGAAEAAPTAGEPAPSSPEAPVALESPSQAVGDAAPIGEAPLDPGAPATEEAERSDSVVPTEEPAETDSADTAGPDTPVDAAEDVIAPAPEAAETEAPATDTTAESTPADGGAAHTADAEVAGDAATGAPAVTEEGVLLLNGLHRVPGEGSAENPYEVDWDTLIAIEKEYNPKKEGMKEVPEWVKPLDGKHVRLTGFIAFPFIAPSADECMVMLNQWDGCCIGVPPTPYDAVEVKLAKAIDLQQGIINYGTITGVFRTDPYLVNGWLIGLYVMDEAKIETAGARDQPGY